MTEETEVQETESVDPVEIDPIPETAPKTKVTRRKAPVIDDPDDAILELRKENEKLRKKLEADSTAKAEKMAEERIKTAKAEAVADAQAKLDERIVEMEERAKARVLKSELKAAAVRAGVVDFDDLFVIMQKDLKKVEYNDDGDIANANEMIAEVKKTKAHLFTGVNTSSTTTAPQARPHVVDKPALQMSKDDYDRAKQRLNTM